MINKIVVIGGGYVGLPLSVLLSKHYETTLIDSDVKKISKLKRNKSPIKDSMIDSYLNKGLSINLDESVDLHLSSENIYILCLPSNYDPETDNFDTSILEKVIHILQSKIDKPKIIIKSTVPVGFTRKLQLKYANEDIVFSPEFLREGSAIFDNLYPSRIVIGSKTDFAKNIADIFKNIAENDPELFFLDSSEAESVKLFSNAYLALRVSFFNELDSFALSKSFNTKGIIEAVCADPRVSDGYNNPSFGYGGYCLPKDTKQLLANYKTVPQNIIKAIVDSNASRKNYISEFILSKIDKAKDTVGIYKLSMKNESDNIRSSSMQGIMKRLNGKNVKMILFEPSLSQDEFYGCRILKNLKDFKQKSNLIITNRLSADLKDVQNKVFTRDIFMEN
ncbi:MAG: UDP-glucose 6-dehydrogenase [Legionellales bacterium]|nr:UDP-glucose 6-dehydrogenase [Legionellales bacterium]OUX64660.1 MAG: UDP-glucose 6-dehydrogenase [Gammaproteobacteria bacterium TMED281]